jgi:hypothetical protein
VTRSKAVCQSCCAPILKEFDKGRESDGRTTDVYCRRCYQSGFFTEPKMTVEEMRETVRARMVELKFPRYLSALLADQVYSLKRWETVKVLASNPIN